VVTSSTLAISCTWSRMLSGDSDMSVRMVSNARRRRSLISSPRHETRHAHARTRGRRRCRPASTRVARVHVDSGDDALIVVRPRPGFRRRERSLGSDAGRRGRSAR
jgi:RNase P protein component